MIWAVVPCKKLDAAHRRLMPVLSDTERRQIATNMLMDVLSALTAATCLDGVLVVGADPAVREIAGSFGARSFSNFVDSGLSASLAAASAMLADEGATGVVAVHGDLPYLTLRAWLSVIVGSPTICPGPNATICAASPSIFRYSRR